jgi:small-conductance mechanosensitive channel
VLSLETTVRERQYRLRLNWSPGKLCGFADVDLYTTATSRVDYRTQVWTSMSWRLFGLKPSIFKSKAALLAMVSARWDLTIIDLISLFCETILLLIVFIHPRIVYTTVYHCICFSLYLIIFMVNLYQSCNQEIKEWMNVDQHIIFP